MGNVAPTCAQSNWNNTSLSASAIQWIIHILMSGSSALMNEYFSLGKLMTVKTEGETEGSLKGVWPGNPLGWEKEPRRDSQFSKEAHTGKNTLDRPTTALLRNSEHNVWQSWSKYKRKTKHLFLPNLPRRIQATKLTEISIFRINCILNCFH